MTFKKYHIIDYSSFSLAQRAIAFILSDLLVRQILVELLYRYFIILVHLFHFRRPFWFNMNMFRTIYSSTRIKLIAILITCNFIFLFSVLVEGSFAEVSWNQFADEFLNDYWTQTNEYWKWNPKNINDAYPSGFQWSFRFRNSSIRFRSAHLDAD